MALEYVAYALLAAAAAYLADRWIGARLHELQVRSLYLASVDEAVDAGQFAKAEARMGIVEKR